VRNQRHYRTLVSRRRLSGRPAVALSALASAVLILHTAPALTAIGPLRRVGWPGLAGVGIPGGVALTFDDGPDPHGSPAVLAALAELGWSATFFMLGSQVARYPDVARSIAAAGHEIGVHGYRHRNHLLCSPSALRSDLRQARNLIADVTATAPRWFRPPYGVLSAGSLAAARDVGLTAVLWTAWGRDWTRTNPEKITSTVLAGLRERGTIVLHDSDCTSTAGSWRNTAQCLPLLAGRLDAQGWQVRTLSKHLCG